MERKRIKLEAVDTAPKDAAVVDCARPITAFVMQNGATDFECAICSLVLIKGGVPDTIRAPGGLFIKCGKCGTMNRVPTDAAIPLT